MIGPHAARLPWANLSLDVKGIIVVLTPVAVCLAFASDARIAFIGVLGSVLAMLLFNRSTLQRVRTLEENARRLALEQPLLPVFDSGDEIGRFGRALQEASAHLDDRRILLETLSAAKEAAEHANAAKSDFLSRMSHELRTPLNAILGFGTLLQRQNGDPLQADCADHIVSAGRRLLALIDEVLEIARVETGQTMPRIEPVDLLGLVEEGVALIRHLASERHIECQIECHTGCHSASETQDRAPRAMADRSLLLQALSALLSNAVRYNIEGGKVFVSIAQAEPRGDAPQRLRITVKDTGAGLSAQDVTRLFTPFVHLDAEAGRVDGAGLGLTVSRRFVETMGGTLTVQSVLGTGSAFHIDLPAIVEPAVAGVSSRPPVAAASREPSGPSPCVVASDSEAGDRKVSVLQIEDSFANQQLVKIVLSTQRPAVQLMSACDGLSGLALAKDIRPAVILLDLQLPDVAGDEILALLRADPDTCDIPVILLTADAMAGSREKLLAAGAYAYVTKPLDIKDLLDSLDEALQSVNAGGKPLRSAA